MVVAAAPEGVNVQVPADIQAALWQKFIFIVAVSSVGAATRQPMGGYRVVPETRRLLQGALEEVAALARAKGVMLKEDIVPRTLANIDVTQADTYASMQNDIMNGRPSELECQTGEVVRLGKALGIPTPVHDFLYAILLPMELKARSEE